MEALYCACCGQPFKRAHQRGPAPLYCSRDCRRQIEVRRRTWSAMEVAGVRAFQEGRGDVRAVAVGW